MLNMKIFKLKFQKYKNERTGGVLSWEGNNFFSLEYKLYIDISEENQDKVLFLEYTKYRYICRRKHKYSTILGVYNVQIYRRKTRGKPRYSTVLRVYNKQIYQRNTKK